MNLSWRKRSQLWHCIAWLLFLCFSRSSCIIKNFSKKHIYIHSYFPETHFGSAALGILWLKSEFAWFCEQTEKLSMWSWASILLITSLVLFWVAAWGGFWVWCPQPCSLQESASTALEQAGSVSVSAAHAVAAVQVLYKPNHHVRCRSPAPAKCILRDCTTHALYGTESAVPCNAQTTGWYLISDSTIELS